MQEAPFYCRTCHNRYTLDKDCLQQVHRGSVQKKPPFLDTESEQMTESKYSDQSVIYKCPICGCTLKEIKDE